MQKDSVAEAVDDDAEAGAFDAVVAAADDDDDDPEEDVVVPPIGAFEGYDDDDLQTEELEGVTVSNAHLENSQNDDLNYEEVHNFACDNHGCLPPVHGVMQTVAVVLIPAFRVPQAWHETTANHRPCFLQIPVLFGHDLRPSSCPTSEMEISCQSNVSWETW